MGAWGPGLYQDDVALDVRDYYKDQLHRGKEGEQITQELIAQNSDILEDPDDGPVFWLALADVQWKMGRLENVVKQNALNIIDENVDLMRWQHEEPGCVKKRLHMLSELKEKLLSPQPEMKKVSQYRLFHCNWKKGDVYAYQMLGDYAKEKGFFEKYVFFVKMDERTWHPGHTVPVVYFYCMISDVLVETKELKQAGYMPQVYAPQAYINNPKLKKRYRLTLLNTSMKVIPKKNLIYMGNIGNVDEIDEKTLTPYAVEWKEFEEYIIQNILEWNEYKFF